MRTSKSGRMTKTNCRKTLDMLKRFQIETVTSGLPDRLTMSIAQHLAMAWQRVRQECDMAGIGREREIK